MTSPLRVCTSCAVHHYENCPDCWGFGLMEKTSIDFPGGIPISASEAMDEDITTPPWKACPTCHSTPKGVPEMGVAP